MNIIFAFMIMCVQVRIQGFLFALCAITGEMSRSEGRGITIEELRHQVQLTRPVLPAMQNVLHHGSSAGKPPPSQDNSGWMFKANWQSINDKYLSPTPVHSLALTFRIHCNSNNREIQGPLNASWLYAWFMFCIRRSHYILFWTIFTEKYQDFL